ncbi:hypothetical protein ACFSUS_18935 [Spirosoma soli]|uniref:Uncharacterized protein n=1 Tax=Spirosoma soli TaxID=1770529 RepID=A0ABW5M6Y3_9BACT
MEPTLNSQSTPNTQSRRKWLRDAAIATTSAAVMPSLLTGCADHRVNPGDGDLGGASAPPDDALYPLAAANLNRMAIWHDHLYSSYTQGYEQVVYRTVEAGEKLTNWTEILVEVFTKLGLTVLEGALEEFPLLGAAIAAAVEQLEKWEFSEKGNKVDATIAEFAKGFSDMHAEVQRYLTELISTKDINGNDTNYQKLREAFKEGYIEFNNKKYTLRDLAENYFPMKDKDEDRKQYQALIDAAFLRFKKSLWNAMFIKAADFHSSYNFSVRCDQSPYRYATKEFYPDKNYPIQAASYLRGYYLKLTDRYEFAYWYFTFDGKALPEGAAEILFKDDVRGNIINPKGLFDRDYVFKQFHREKQDFGIYHDLRTDSNWRCDDGFDFDHNTDNYEFTGGEFHVLTKPK